MDQLLGRLYRARRPYDGTWHQQRVGDVGRSLFVRLPAKQPDNPRTPFTVWQCDNSKCPVADVSIYSRYDRAPAKPSAARCPACRRPLRFLHFLQLLQMAPVADHPPSLPPGEPAP
jgi:hypothetical protein